MAYLVIYSLSALMAHLVISEFKVVMPQIIHNEAFSNSEKNRLYDLVLFLYRHEGIIFVPIVNTIVGFLVAFVLLIHKTTENY